MIRPPLAPVVSGREKFQTSTALDTTEKTAPA